MPLPGQGGMGVLMYGALTLKIFSQKFPQQEPHTYYMIRICLDVC